MADLEVSADIDAFMQAADKAAARAALGVGDGEIPAYIGPVALAGPAAEWSFAEGSQGYLELDGAATVTITGIPDGHSGSLSVLVVEPGEVGIACPGLVVKPVDDFHTLEPQSLPPNSWLEYSFKRTGGVVRLFGSKRTAMPVPETEVTPEIAFNGSDEPYVSVAPEWTSATATGHRWHVNDAHAEGHDDTDPFTGTLADGDLVTAVFHASNPDNAAEIGSNELEFDDDAEPYELEMLEAPSYAYDALEPGESITVIDGTWSETPDEVLYTWYGGYENTFIAYLLGPDDHGKTLHARVTVGTSGGGHGEYYNDAVVVEVWFTPVNNTPPTIEYDDVENRWVGSGGDWSYAAVDGYSYEWFVDDALIEGETATELYRAYDPEETVVMRERASNPLKHAHADSTGGHPPVPTGSLLMDELGNLFEDGNSNNIETP